VLVVFCGVCPSTRKPCVPSAFLVPPASGEVSPMKAIFRFAVFLM
jgi:hypothetical protein